MYPRIPPITLLGAINQWLSPIVRADRKGAHRVATIYLHAYLTKRERPTILAANNNLKRRMLMPQISLYIDEPTLRKIENAASRQHISISKWVAEQIRSRVDPIYPKDFEDLFGSVSDDSFVRPEQYSHDLDSPREGF